MATAAKPRPRTTLNQLHYTSDMLAAPREKVWRVLWDDASFRDWRASLPKGSYAVSDWKEGSTVQFIDPGKQRRNVVSHREETTQRVHVLPARG